MSYYAIQTNTLTLDFECYVPGDTELETCQHIVSTDDIKEWDLVMHKLR